MDVRTKIRAENKKALNSNGLPRRTLMNTKNRGESMRGHPFLLFSCILLHLFLLLLFITTTGIITFILVLCNRGILYSSSWMLHIIISPWPYSSFGRQV